MSNITLQRVVTRMLFDPQFTASIYARNVETLRGLELTSREVDWLVAHDQRRWSLDQTLTHRALEGILLYCPISVALYVEMGGPVLLLLSFFQSDRFHTCIQNREYLAEAFLSWLQSNVNTILRRRGQRTFRPHPWFDLMCQLELATMKVTRVPLYQAPQHSPSQSQPIDEDSSVITSPKNTISVYQQLIRSLEERGEGGVGALSGIPKLSLPSPDHDQEVSFLIQNTESGLCFTMI